MRRSLEEPVRQIANNAGYEGSVVVERVKDGKDGFGFNAETERGHFARAALLAEARGLSEKTLRELRLNALWQISAQYRNAPGTKKLAQQYGLSKKDLEDFFNKRATENRNQGDDRDLEPCYDQRTGKYLSFEEWLNYLLRHWEKLPVLE